MHPNHISRKHLIEAQIDSQSSRGNFHPYNLSGPLIDSTPSWSITDLPLADEEIMRRRIQARKNSKRATKHLHRQTVTVQKHPIISGQDETPVWCITEKPECPIGVGSKFFVLLVDDTAGNLYFDDAFTIVGTPRRKYGCYTARIQSDAGNHPAICLQINEEWFTTTDAILPRRRTTPSLWERLNCVNNSNKMVESH